MIIDKFTIQTQDSIAVARDQLTWQIDDDKPSPFKLRSNRVILHGEVSENTFRLCCLQGALPITTIAGWFESVQLGTVVHLEVKLNLSLVIVYLLFFCTLLLAEWKSIINNLDGRSALYIGMMIVFTISSICSCQDDMRFYRNKLPQIFS